MCSIIASFNKETFEDLVDKNQHRGNFSFSYTEVNGTDVVEQIKAYGEFAKDLVSKEYYKIGHVQAPTGGMVVDESRIHPVIIGDSMLWHNGLITPKGIKFLQEKLETTEQFDTKLLIGAIQKYGFSILDHIEGLFSCLYIEDNEVYIFRTKHGKLYIDESMNISSERFVGSKCIGYNRIYKLDLNKKHIIPKQPFITKRFNFVIAGEL